jgi:predicted nucleotidyltransferase
VRLWGLDRLTVRWLLAKSASSSSSSVTSTLFILSSCWTPHARFLRTLAAEHGYSRIGVFGSVARGEARQDSDISLIVEAPEGTSSFGFLRFKQVLEQVLGRELNLV